MPTFFLRRLTTKILHSARLYPKLSFFGGIAAVTALSCVFKYQKNDPKIEALNLSTPIKMEKKATLINLEKFIASIKDLPLIEFKTRCPLYPKERTYQGYELLKILDAINIDKANNDLVMLVAKDGFISYIPFSLIERKNPIIAVHQKLASAGKAWEPVFHPLSGQTDGGPFYLMWPGASINEVAENYWAFGVTEITFGSFQKLFGAISPKTQDPTIQKGFKLFAQNCSCCHSFFGKGNAIGPSFEQIPKKYRIPGSIATYAGNPPEYSVMPKQDLTANQLLAVEAYARYEIDSFNDAERLKI